MHIPLPSSSIFPQPIDNQTSRLVEQVPIQKKKNLSAYQELLLTTTETKSMKKIIKPDRYNTGAPYEDESKKRGHSCSRTPWQINNKFVPPQPLKIPVVINQIIKKDYKHIKNQEQYIYITETAVLQSSDRDKWIAAMQR